MLESILRITGSGCTALLLPGLLTAVQKPVVRRHVVAGMGMPYAARVRRAELRLILLQLSVN